MTECCNHNCNEGRDCPVRKARLEQRNSVPIVTDELSTDLDAMLDLTGAVFGGLTVICVIGIVIWLLYNVAPIFAALVP